MTLFTLGGCENSPEEGGITPRVCEAQRKAGSCAASEVRTPKHRPFVRDHGDRKQLLPGARVCGWRRIHKISIGQVNASWLCIW